MNRVRDHHPRPDPLEEHLRRAYAGRAAAIPDDLPLSVKLERHIAEQVDLDTVRPSAVATPLSAPPQNTVTTAQFEQRHANGGRRWAVAVAALVATVSAVAVLQISRPWSGSDLQRGAEAFEPGYILGPAPAGFDGGSHIRLVNPKELAASPGSTVTQLRQRHGTGRVSILPVEVAIGGPWVSGPFIEVAGKRLTVVSQGTYRLVSVPVDGRYAQIDSSGVDLPTLERFATKIAVHGDRFAVPDADLPTGWEQRRAPTDNGLEAILRSTTYARNGNTIRVTVRAPPDPSWDVQVPASLKPHKLAVRTGTFSVIRFPVNGWNAVSASMDVTVGANGPDVPDPEQVLPTLRKATATQWASMSTVEAHAIASAVVTGTVVDQGTIEGHAYRTIRLRSLPGSAPTQVPVFITGLVGVTGAIFTTAQSGHARYGVSWVPGGAIIRVDSELKPRTATLQLTGRKPVTAPFLPAVKRQDVQVAFFPGLTPPATGTFTVTSSDASVAVVDRDVVTGLAK